MKHKLSIKQYFVLFLMENGALRAYVKNRKDYCRMYLREPYSFVRDKAFSKDWVREAFTWALCDKTIEYWRNLDREWRIVAKELTYYKLLECGNQQTNPIEHGNC